MSRSGYSDECDDLELYRTQVENAIRGKRGQRLLVDLVRGLDALPEKKLIKDELENAEGAVCALGAVGKLRGVPMGSGIDPDDHDDLSKCFDIARCLAAEVMYVNDEAGRYLKDETPEERWHRVRLWALGNLLAETVLSMPGAEVRADV